MNQEHLEKLAGAANAEELRRAIEALCHTLVLLSAVAVTCLFPVLSFAHDRGLDRYGCHHHRKHGGYYCHRGAMVGQSFKSQQEMLAAMKGKEKAPSSSKRPSTQNESKPR